jgi:hypothetical protein
MNDLGKHFDFGLKIATTVALLAATLPPYKQEQIKSLIRQLSGSEE